MDEPDGRGWGVAFVAWVLGMLFLAAVMLFDLIAGLLRR